MRRTAVVVAFAGLAVACRGPAPRRDAIRIAAPYELSTLDPHAENSVSNFAILSNIYEPLVTTDADMAVRPALATSWECPDLLTWIFHLRSRVAFHGGRPLGAGDVVYSFNRLLRDSSLAMRSYLLSVSEVRAIDADTVQIRTSRPLRNLLNRLSFVLIVPKGSSAATLKASTDGTGPYILVEWMPGQRIRLRRHDGHWGARPALREVDFELGPGTQEAAEGLLAGRYQLVQANSKTLEAIVGASPRHHVIRRDNIYVKFLGFDLSRDVTPFCRVTPNPFRDVRVRRAIHIAIDRPRLVAGLTNYGVPASQPLPRFIFGFDPAILDPASDPDRARSLLKAVGLGGGFEAGLHTRRLFAEAAFLLRDQLAAVGIRLDVHVLPDPEFFEVVNRRGASFWLSRWGCPTGDAGDLLEMYVHSTDRLRQFGQMNYGEYANAELDVAIEKSAELDSPEERRLAVQQIIREITDELVMVPLYIDQDVYAVERSLSWRPRNDSYIRVAEIGVAR